MKYFVRHKETGLFWDGVPNDGVLSDRRPGWYLWGESQIKAWGKHHYPVAACRTQSFAGLNPEQVEVVYARSRKASPRLFQGEMNNAAPQSDQGEIDKGFCYQFPAIKGIQAGYEYYSAMVPVRLLPKLFTFDSEELPPEHRAQRVLNRSRVKAIARYILGNKFWVLPAITVSVNARMTFNGESDIGTLSIPMDAQALINDGQHRVSGLIAALKEDPELGDETINCTIFWDLGLTRSQTIFSDINLNASKPPSSISRLYDHRDPIAEILRQALNRVADLKGLVEMEKGSISKTSRKLWTLQLWHEFVNILFPAITLAANTTTSVKDLTPEQISALARKYAEIMVELRFTLPGWKGDGDPREERLDNIAVSGVALMAIAHYLGDSLENWEQRIDGLGQVNWNRTNPDWHERIIFGGRLTKNRETVKSMANYLREVARLPE